MKFMCSRQHPPIGHHWLINITLNSHAVDLYLELDNIKWLADKLGSFYLVWQTYQNLPDWSGVESFYSKLLTSLEFNRLLSWTGAWSDYYRPRRGIWTVFHRIDYINWKAWNNGIRWFELCQVSYSISKMLEFTSPNNRF